MKKILLVLVLMLSIAVISEMITNDMQSFAQYPAPPSGCCKQRDWLAADWRETDLSFRECESLNDNRDNLDDIFQEKGYVWWDQSCRL